MSFSTPRTRASRDRVCIVTTVHRAFSTRIFHREARTLVKAGYDVAIIAQHDRDEVVDGVKVLSLRVPRNRSARLLGLGWRAFRLAFRERADVYHFHDPEFLLWGWLLQKVARRPVVYDVHEYFSESLEEKHWLPAAARRPLARVLGAAERHIAGRLAGIVTVNEDLARRFSFRGHPATVVPNYPLRELFQCVELDSDLAERYGGQKIVVYVGGLTEARGISQLIRVMALVSVGFPSARLLLIGAFQSSAYEFSVRKLISSLKLLGVVELVGRVPHEEVPRYLAAGDVGVFLPLPVSRRYSWGEPTKYFEYCAAGLPVVMSDLPAKRRLIERVGNGIVVDPFDTAGAACAIIDLLREPERRKSLGQAGRRAFMKGYCWEAVEGRLLDLYERLQHQ